MTIPCGNDPNHEAMHTLSLEEAHERDGRWFRDEENEMKPISEELYLALWQWRQAEAGWAAACLSRANESREVAIADRRRTAATEALFIACILELPAGGPG